MSCCVSSGSQPIRLVHAHEPCAAAAAPCTRSGAAGARPPLDLPPPLQPPPADLAPQPPPVDLSPQQLQQLADLVPILRSALRRNGLTEADAADLSQTIFLEWVESAKRRVARGGPAVPPHARPYALACARFAAIRVHREQQRRAEVSLHAWMAAGADWPVHEDEYEPPDPALDVELAALAQMTSPANWRAFHAHSLLGMPVAEIARIEQIPVPTACTRLRRGRLALRAALGRLRARHRSS